jgi:hypothetical protein
LRVSLGLARGQYQDCVAAVDGEQRRPDSAIHEPARALAKGRYWDHIAAVDGERVGDPQVGGKHVYWWYLVRKECGNLYLDMESATGSEVSGIRGGTATGAPL